MGMNWKRALTGFFFACLGSAGLMSSMPMLLGLCDPAGVLCPAEPNILVYILLVASLLVLLFGMGLLIGSGRTSSSEAQEPQSAKDWQHIYGSNDAAAERVARHRDADMTPPNTAPSAPASFDREAVLADMKAPPVFGNAKRKHAVSQPNPLAEMQYDAETGNERAVFERAMSEEALPPTPPPAVSPPMPNQNEAATTAPAIGHFGAHMASSPMAPRRAPKMPGTQ